jgi:GNAT superfamily N-acetyltransferase
VGKIPEKFETDLLQLLNVETARYTGDRIFVHSPVDDHYEVRNLEGPVAVFDMTELPGCCGVIVSYHSQVREEHRKKGMGQFLLEARMSAARNKGYGLMMATVEHNNTVERKLLESNGWISKGEFRNPKTGHVIATYQVNL